MTLRFWPGETVRLRVDFSTPDGSPMAATGVVFQVRPPDGTAAPAPAAGVPISNAPGAFMADIAPLAPGRWAVRATCDGPSPAAVEGEFIVAKSLVL